MYEFGERMKLKDETQVDNAVRFVNKQHNFDEVHEFFCHETAQFESV